MRGWSDWTCRKNEGGVRLRARLEDLEAIREALLRAPESRKRAAALAPLEDLIRRAREEEDAIREQEGRRRGREEEKRREEEEWWRRLYADRAARARREGLDVLGLAWPATADEIRSAYREKAKALHPDAGGNAEEFVALQRAYEWALRWCE
jgi:hypothetical protein